MTDSSTNIIILKKNNITVKILPNIGGRIVGLYINNSKNILKSDPELWEDKNKPELSAFSDFKAYNGHTVWVGPQCDWWKYQNLNLERKKEAAPWPPDPYLIYSNYTIQHKTESSVVLKGTASPISGVRFDKEIAINDDGSVFIQTTIVNTSDKPVTWDIWFNTRMDGYCKSYVPIVSEKDISVKPVLSDTSQFMPYSTEQNMFSYEPTQPEKHFNERSSKTFIYPDNPIISGFTDEAMLLIHFDKHQKNEIHEEQALIEIYNHTEHDTDNALLELEYHSPYKTILPNDSFNAWEVWKLYPYNGENSRKSHIEFLNRVISEDL